MEGYSAKEVKSLTIRFMGNTAVSTGTYKYDVQVYPISPETKEDDADEVTRYTYEYQ